MFHEINIIGTVGTAPEMRYSNDGKGFCQIRVVATRKLSAERKENTWFKVTTFDKLAENMNQYVKKGQTIHLIGRLVSDKETGGPRIYTKQDGTAASTFEVVAREFRIVDFKTNGQPQQGQYQQTAQQRPQPQPQAQVQPLAQAQASDDDIPW